MSLRDRKHRSPLRLLVGLGMAGAIAMAVFNADDLKRYVRMRTM